MQIHSRSRRCVPFVTLLFLVACARDADPIAKSTHPAKTQTASVLRPVGVEVALAPKEGNGSTELERVALASRGLLEHIPKSAPLVLRFPHVEQLGDFWSKSSISRWFATPVGAIALQQLTTNVKPLLDRLVADNPGAAAFQKLLPKLHGELVVALTRLDLGVKAANDAPAFELSVWFDAAEQSDDLRGALGAWISALPTNQKTGVAPTKDTWGWRGLHDGWGFELRSRSTTFSLAFSNFDRDGMGGDAPLALDKSFVASDVARTAPDLGARDGVACVEAYVQLESIWRAVKDLAPKNVIDALDATHSFTIQGGSIVVGLEGKGTGEVVTWNARGAQDLVSKAFNGAPLDPSLARWIYADAPYAGLFSFDAKSIFGGAIAALEPEARRAFERDFSAAGQRCGIDFRGDLIDNLGPTFAYASNSGVDGLGAASSPEFVLAIAVHDESKAQRLLETAVTLVGLSGSAHTDVYQNRRITSLVLPTQPGAPKSSGQHAVSPAWCVDHGTLLVASDDSVLRASIRAASESNATTHVALRRALSQAGPEVFALLYTHGESTASDTLAIGRHFDDGWSLEQHKGNGALISTGFVASAAVVASIALPKLMSERVESNERAAVKVLKDVAHAEATCRDKRWIDLDRDGRGEFATLEELGGHAPLRGGAAMIDPPLLAQSFERWSSGASVLSGYVFRVDLEGRDGKALSRVESSPSNAIDSDHSEKNFVAFAWPVDYGTSGRKVFALDASGGIWTSDNSASTQHYSGFDRAPDHVACRDLGQPGPIDAKRASWRGGDGGTWFWFEAPPPVR